MKCLLSLMLLISFVGACIGRHRLSPREVYILISVPEGWNVVGLGCCGIAASDSTNLGKRIIALNHLHQGFKHATGSYHSWDFTWRTTCRQDFSQGDSIVTDMSFIDYEDNQDLVKRFCFICRLVGFRKVDALFLRSYGIPAKGSFTVITTDLMGYGTTVNFLGGSMLLRSIWYGCANAYWCIKSIQLNPEFSEISALHQKRVYPGSIPAKTNAALNHVMNTVTAIENIFKLRNSNVRMLRTHR